MWKDASKPGLLCLFGIAISKSAILKIAILKSAI
jgi:hypothetical protein